MVDTHLNPKDDALMHRLVPASHLAKAVRLTHGLQKGVGLSYHERRKAAMVLSDRYRSAALVITNRLHCALPCLAFGTPCLFIHTGIDTDPRFDDTIKKLIGDGKSLPAGWEWNALEIDVHQDRRRLAVVLAGEMKRRVFEWLDRAERGVSSPRRLFAFGENSSAEGSERAE